MKTVAFRAMAEGSAEDYALLDAYEREYVQGQPERIIALLREQANSFAGYRIDRLQHSLQTATRAERDGADEDWIAAALLHDIGDGVAAFLHGDFAAAVIRPFVRDEVHWAVKYHPVFQEHYYAHHYGRDPNRRDRWRDHPHYAATVRFCERWDQASFDPAYDTLPLAHFEPLLRRVLGRPPRAHAD